MAARVCGCGVRGERWRVMRGDCVRAMRRMPADLVDAVVCDPPYGLEFMGKAWDSFAPDDVIRRSGWSTCSTDAGFTEGIAGVTPKYGRRRSTWRCNSCGKRDTFRNDHECTGGWTPEWVDAAPVESMSFQAWTAAWAAEALRVAKPGAHLVAFGGTRMHHRLMAGLEDAGWEIRDCLMWLYGSGFPKSHNGPWGGTALKPAWEPVVLARKQPAGTIAETHATHGTGGLNIDGCRVGTEGGTRREGKATAPNDAGWANMRGHGIDSIDAGRWPANVLLDGAGAAVLDADSGDGEGGPSRFFYCGKAAREDRNAGCGGMPERQCNDGRQTSIDNAYQRGDSLRRNHHPTVKPTDLMRWLCRLVTPAGGLVLDPFTGSGSTGRAARLEGLRFLGIEREREYVEIARRRIAHAEADAPALFA